MTKYHSKHASETLRYNRTTVFAHLECKVGSNNNGYLCNANDYVAFAKAINDISNDNELKSRMVHANIEKIKQYDVSVVEKEIRNIYSEVLSED